MNLQAYIRKSILPVIICLLAGNCIAQVAVNKNQVFVLTENRATSSNDYIGILQDFIDHPGEMQAINNLNLNKDQLFDYASNRLVDEARPLTPGEASDLMLALSLVNDVRAKNALLDIASHYIYDPDVTQQALLLLRDMPATAPVTTYVDEVFKLYRGNVQLSRTALLYCLTVKNDAGMRWAAYYRSPGTDPQLRFAGLALAAMLIKDDQVTRWILDELTKVPAVPGYQQYTLLQALYVSVSDAEYEQLSSRFTVAPVALEAFQRLRDFSQASGEEKHRLAGFMLASPHSDQQQAALKYYITNQNIMDIWPQLDIGRRLMLVRLSNASGLSILPEPEKVKAPEPDQTNALPGYILGFILLAVLGLAFIYRRIRVQRSLRTS